MRRYALLKRAWTQSLYLTTRLPWLKLHTPIGEPGRQHAADLQVKSLEDILDPQRASGVSRRISWLCRATDRDDERALQFLERTYAERPGFHDSSWTLTTVSIIRDHVHGTKVCFSGSGFSPN